MYRTLFSSFVHVDVPSLIGFCKDTDVVNQLTALGADT